MVERRSTPEKRARVAQLKAGPPTAELALWELLRRKQIAGARFRRRAIVLGWIPDFWCPAAKLAIEIDAGDSESKRQRDQVRDAQLARHGVRTLHVKAEDILRAPGKVITAVAAALGTAGRDLRA